MVAVGSVVWPVTKWLQRAKWRGWVVGAELWTRLTVRGPVGELMVRVAPKVSSKREVPARSWGGVAVGGTISSRAQR
ncbi:hypothetical protein EV643_108243 [Kribbella sp. VKM Ac-2527]|uniref:Uncharacterized protein n=1 Tax=Kribbella caucasensis TaxID=2512215 RepID=A0A4V3C9Y8_9ACTN|nr:hypothetical protein EV643_108243 [Kribbella sp. VKM Ac-2527]